MEKYLYVTDGLNKIGPFSKEEVTQMLYSAHISITDYVIDSRDNRMCPLLQHEDFGGDGSVNAMAGPTGGIAGLTPKSLSEKYGFAQLRNQEQIKKESKYTERMRAKQQKQYEESHLKEIIQVAPNLDATANPNIGTNAGIKTDKGTSQNTKNNEPISPAAQSTSTKSIEVDEMTTTSTMKSNNSVSFFLKSRDREYGPLKFLVLVSLLKQNKIRNDTKVRTELEKDYRPLSDYLPLEVEQTINITPILNAKILPRTQWKRKNVRIDYEEMVLLNNQRYSLVGKTLDLSAEGLSLVWVYDIPVNEEFEISLFDLSKNLVNVRARLSRKEPVDSPDGIHLYKAVFIFKSIIQIKDFIT